jgi:hypothetical protein
MGLRHKAEQFKFFKFEFLIDPRLWGTDPEKRACAVKELQDRAQKNEKIETKDELKRELERCAESEIFPEEPPHLAGSQANAYTLYNLVDYYLTKRCMSQLEYFQHKSQQLSQKDPRIKLLPPLLFFLSISAALVHFSLDSFDTYFQHSAAAQSAEITAQTPAFGLSITLIIIAAALPVIGAGVRTFRSAYEAARNRSRYCAASSALQPTADRLVDRLADRLARDAEFLRRPSTEGKMTVDAPDVFRDMWRCEQILQAEHHEWVRLMMEAEWFG